MKSISRVNFSNIIAKYKQLGKGNVRLTQSSLFLTKTLTGTQTAYTFDVLENQNQNAEEIRLNINDEFIITELGVYLFGTINADGDPARNIMVTNTLRQLSVAAAGDVAPLYQGKLKMSVNNVVYMEKWDLKKHEIVPFDQFTYDSTGATPAANKADGSKYGEDGMYELAPMVTLSGAKKNEITIEMPVAPSPGTYTWQDQGAITSTIVLNKVAIMLRGLNAQNAARFQ